MLIDLKSLNKAEQNTKEPENQPVLFLSVPECRNLADSETSLRKQIGILEHNAVSYTHLTLPTILLV